jgi:hypothetical protein
MTRRHGVHHGAPGVPAIFLTALACAAFHPGAAGADEALHLTWIDCWTGAAAASDETFECDVNSGERRLIAGFTLGTPIDSVIAIEAVIDLVHEDGTLPPWWHLDPGGCRDGALAATADLAGLDGCADMWGGEGNALVQGYEIEEPRGGPNQARIKVVAAVASASARSLDTATSYAAVALRLDNRKTVSPEVCAGCDGDACLVLNSILVRRLPGGTGDVFLQIPAAGNGQMATWGSGLGADCAAVPARNATWGRVKTLYRR